MTKYTKEEQEFIEGLASMYDSDNLHDEFIVDMNDAMGFNLLEGVI